MRIYFAIALIGLARTSWAQAPSPPVDYTQHPWVALEEKNSGPKRIISIAPSITEMCAALGLSDRLVGRTQYCNHPTSTQRATVIGAYSDTNLERIVSLSPDLILITESSKKTASSLSGIGLPFETVPDSTLDDVYEAMIKIGQLTGRPKTARHVVQQLKSDLERLAEQNGRQHPGRILVSVGPLPLQAQSIYVAGPGSYLDSLLTMAGYRNAAEGHLAKPWGKISLETIVAAQPDVMVEIRPPAQAVDRDQLLEGWSALNTVPAIKRGRIHALTQTAAFIPGPRVNLVLNELVTILNSSNP